MNKGLKRIERRERRRERRLCALNEYKKELAEFAEARLQGPPIYAAWRLRNARKLMNEFKFTEQELAA